MSVFACVEDIESSSFSRLLYFPRRDDAKVKNERGRDVFRFFSLVAHV